MVLIGFFENNFNINDLQEETYQHLPALYKSQNKKQNLVTYLKSEKVQDFLYKQKSLSAVNLQCDYGYDASIHLNNQIGDAFRFAVQRSSSREIELNELTDAEIEALVSVGKEEEAFNLTQKIFLEEERLKALLIILRNSEHLQDSSTLEIKNQVKNLTCTIDFEHIPDKAIELAKLMLPIDFVDSLSIIDRVAKISKDKSQIDKLYTFVSLAYNNECCNIGEDSSKQDIMATRISDDGIRKMASAMKNIMSDISVEQLLEELKNLPTDSSRLYFLQFWIPENKNKEGIQNVVFYALNLVIQVSDSVMPKVSLLKEYCKPIIDMDSSIVYDIVSRIDAVIEYIKFPSIDYVKLQLLIISALSKIDKKKAEDRLQNLYVEIDDYEDKCVTIKAKSLLLKDFDKLGSKEDVESWLSMTGNKLKDDIIENIKTQLENSAFHMKVVEGPIEALVVSYPSLIKEVIPLMNTEERRCKAYLFAITEYVRQIEIDQIDWEYFNYLYSKITFNPIELANPLRILILKITQSKIKDDSILNKVKELYSKIENIEDETVKCYALSTVYVWLMKNFTSDAFAKQKVKPSLDKTWDAIDIPSIKAEMGYRIAQILSGIDMKIEANEYIKKTKEIKECSLNPIDSFEKAYFESMSLYVHSIGLLIRAKLSTEDDISKFSNILDYDKSKGMPMIWWSRIALEYYNIGEHLKFNEIVNSHLQESLDGFSKYYQKKILYNIAPALFLSGPDFFLNRLSYFDSFFKELCLQTILDFIVMKYPYLEECESKISQQHSLDYPDCENILKLIDNSEDECFIFEAIKTITSSIINKSNQVFSKEQIVYLISQLEKFVTNKLPTKNGIQHNGYKIACDAMINACRQTNNKLWSDYESDIESITNVADRSFLYTHISHYIKKRDLSVKFLEKAVETAKEITGGFDRMNRLDMCLSESFDTNRKMSSKIAKTAIELLVADKNGTYQDCKKIIDIIHDKDPDLANEMLDLVDDDPVRKQYKKSIKRHLDSNARIDLAKKDLKKINALSSTEKRCYYRSLLESVVGKKNTYRDVDKTSCIISSIYETPISEAKRAILYFMENAYWKHKSNNRHADLLKSINTSLFGNLSLVLSVASGTKDQMLRIKDIMNGGCLSNQGGLVMTGQNEKGLKIMLDWFSKNQGTVLRIIDPYFHPKDLKVIKSFFNIKNDLSVTILTHLQSNDALDEYQISWNNISSELTGNISIITVCYEDDHSKCPFHDRWWILYDSEEDQCVGKRLSSIGGLGNRDSEISDIDDVDAIMMNVWNRYVNNRVQKNDGKRLSYSDIEIK